MNTRKSILLITAMLSLSAALGCSARHAPPPLFEGMGSHTRPISAATPLAQRYFDQGLVWMFAFNHDEAIRAFEHAARLAPESPMPWWGVSLSHGPHINNPMMTADASQKAWDALQQALARIDRASPAERDLIRALEARYSDPPPEDRSALEAAYAEAMRRAWHAHRGDADVGAMFAESLMDRRPWDLWKRDGSPQEGTEEIVATLEEVLRLQPDHPGALHYYIHAVEASPRPERAMAAADRLRNLVPASGHLVHMPSHIDVRTGRWAAASDANERAIDADRRYREQSPRQGLYHMYMAHNHHFLAYSAMMEGRSADALRAARAMAAGVPRSFLRENAALVDGYTPIVLETLMRFGRWDEILREPPPPRYLPITTAWHHFTRGVALAAKGDVQGARREQRAFEAARARVPEGALMAINPASKVLPIAERVLEAEIALRLGDLDRSAELLREAIVYEDELQYMEPPDWPQPVRHILGAVLVKAGRFAEAEAVYREDLRRLPENGWSLWGLSRCLHAQGKKAEGGEADHRHAAAWKRADIRIGATCLCVEGGQVQTAGDERGAK